MTNAVVSIIIPCFNAAQTISETIKSCTDQDFKEFEIIIVDDHSSDDSRAISAALAREDKRVRCFTNEGKGQSAARNFGMSRAKGNFVKFLDADDCLSADVLREQVGCLEGRSQGLAFCAWAHFTNTPGDQPTIAQSTDRDCDAVDAFLAELWVDNMYPLHAWLIPNTLLTSDMQWDESLTQNADGEFFARVIAKANELRFSEGTAFYRKPVPGHVSQSIGSKHMLSQLRVMRSYRKICADLDDLPHLISGYRYQVCSLAYRAATTVEEMSHMRESLDLLDTHNHSMLFDFPSAAMRATAQCIGIKNALLFRSWVTRVQNVISFRE